MKSQYILTLAVTFCVTQVYANKLIITPGNVNNLGISMGFTYNIHGGDTVFITDGIYGRIYLAGISGAPGNKFKILLENPDMTWGGSSCSLLIEDCHYFDFISPYGHYAHINGHRGTSKSSSGMQVHQSDHFTIKGLMIDSTGGFGLQVKTDVNTSDLKHTSWPYYTMDSIRLEDIHISNVNNEGFYIGHTGVQNGGIPAGDTIAPLRWFTMANCSVENTGWDGVQVSNSLYNNVHNIQIRYPALLNRQSQSTGLTIQNNTSGVFDSISIYKPTNSGMFIFSVDSTTFSNIVIDQVSSDAQAVFIDNRPIFYGTAISKINLTNITIHASGGSNNGFPVHDQNGDVNGARKARPAIWRNVTYDGYASKIVDSVPNKMIGGTEGSDPIAITIPVDTSIITLPINIFNLTSHVKNATGPGLSYSWDIVSGPGQGEISQSSMPNARMSKLVAGTYNVHVTVIDNNGEKAEHTSAIVVRPQPLVKLANKPVQEFNIYPNPVADHFTLAINNDGMGKMMVRIANMQGQLMKVLDVYKDKPSMQLNIPANGLAAGSYLVSVSSKGKTETKKIMKL